MADTTIVVEAPALLGAAFNTGLNAESGDVNGDGLLDIVVGRNFGSPDVYLNNGTPTPFADVLPQTIAPSDPQQAARLADLNHDGWLDIIGVGFNVPTRIYFNNATASPFAGVTGTPLDPSSTDSSTSVDVGDVNGDGLIDIALSNTNQRPSRVYLNNGTSEPFSPATVVNIGAGRGFSEQIALGDVNGDGRVDATLAGQSDFTVNFFGVQVFLNNGTSDPYAGVQPISLLSRMGVFRLNATDVNGDQRLDLLVADTGELPETFIFINTGSSTQPFTSFSALTPNPKLRDGCGGLATTDVNMDGRVDLILGCSAGFASPFPPFSTEATALGAIYLNNGTADPFKGVSPVDIPRHANDGFTLSAEIADLTGNGRLTLILAEGASANLFPVTLDQNPRTVEDRLLTSMNRFMEIDVLANDTDADGTIVKSSLTVDSPPLHGIVRINTSTRGIVYQPDSGFSGVDTLTYTVQDNLGVSSKPGIVRITVQAPPIAANDAATTRANQPVSIDVLANDSSAGTLDRASLTITTQPATGTASIDPTAQRILYAPGPEFRGTDSFQYIVRDDLAASSNVAIATVTVNPVEVVLVPARRGGGGAFGWLLVLVLGAFAAIVRGGQLMSCRGLTL